MPATSVWWGGNSKSQWLRAVEAAYAEEDEANGIVTIDGGGGGADAITAIGGADEFDDAWRPRTGERAAPESPPPFQPPPFQPPSQLPPDGPGLLWDRMADQPPADAPPLWRPPTGERANSPPIPALQDVQLTSSLCGIYVSTSAAGQSRPPLSPTGGGGGGGAQPELSPLSRAELASGLVAAPADGRKAEVLAFGDDGAVSAPLAADDDELDDLMRELEAEAMELP